MVIPFTGQRLDKPGSLVSNQVEHVLVRQGQSCSETRYQFKCMELVEAMCVPKPKFSEKVSIHTGGSIPNEKLQICPSLYLVTMWVLGGAGTCASARGNEPPL